MNIVSYSPKQKVTLPFAHEFEKSYETLVPLVPSWSRTFERDRAKLLLHKIPILTLNTINSVCEE